MAKYHSYGEQLQVTVMLMLVRCVLLVVIIAVMVVAKERKNHLSFQAYSEYIVFRNSIATKIANANLTLLVPGVLNQAGDSVFATLLNKVPGDISEFGVYKGGGSIMMASVLFFLEPDTTRVVHMFDSFAGHPDYKASKEKDFDMQPYSGQIIAPIEGVLAALKEFGLIDRYNAKQIVLHKGWFKDTVPLLNRPLALIRADGDAYTSTMDILNNAYKLLSPRGVVIVDDYDDYQSCRNAIHDFFKEQNIPMEDLKFVNHKKLGMRPFWTKKV